MRKKTIALLLSLALTLGVAIVALAADDTTEGSIKFKSGDIIILPPPGPEDPCCDCFGKEPENDCECLCHEYDKYDDPRDDPGFKTFDLGANLYFGEWNIGAFGTYDSNNEEHNDTGKNEFTGVYVINQTPNEAKIEVSISEFAYNSTDKLTGATLTLKAMDGSPVAGAGYNIDDSEQKATQKLEQIDDPYLILTVPAGARIKAIWYGSLEVPLGSAIYAGTAKAILTWTDATGTP